ncbi:MAG: hypothetical protein M3Q79_00030 [bacterium]|nr:hypothetical protein [bacterium]
MNVSNIINAKKAFTVGLLTMGLILAPASFAFADHESGVATYEAKLKQLNGSGVRGDLYAMVDGDQATVRLVTHGASENLPHAQHFHIGGNSQCPSPSADTDGDGFISSVEGAPSYGPVMVSLTTTGDVDASSGLAVDRFPVASSDGTVTYERTFTLPAGVTAADVANGVVVQHGISDLFEDPNVYDGAKRSTLGDMTLPFEATVPSACGDLKPDRAEKKREQARAKQMRQDEREQRREDRHNSNANNGGASNSYTVPGSDNSIMNRRNSETSSTNRNDVGLDTMIKKNARSGDASSNRKTNGGDSSRRD